MSEALDTARALANVFRERDAQDAESFPAANVADLKAARLTGAAFTRAEGGLDASLPEAVAVVEQIAAASASTALLLAMPLGLACVYASPVEPPAAHRDAWFAQRAAVTADFAAGRWYAACNSERGAGGSLAATQTIATRDAGGAFRLTGEKILASGGRFADVFFSTGKVDPADLPGCGIVEFFFVETNAPGVAILDDWDGFGMRSTESQTVRYDGAPTTALMGYPDFIAHGQLLSAFYVIFSAVPLGCAAAMLAALGSPAPASAALRVRLNDAVMRYESLRAYLLETAEAFRPAAGPAMAARVLRCKTYVTQESTRICADLMALGGGRHYRRTGAVARALADSFAGTALRPPLPLALETLAEQFSLGAAAELA